MRTDDLIGALVTDADRPVVPLRRNFATAVLLGIAAAGVLFFAAIGPRHDIATAAGTVRFLAKFVEAGCLTAAALLMVTRLVRPAVPIGAGLAALAGVAALLAIAVGLELASVPAADWRGRLIGTNALHCLALIPLLALAPLAALMAAARHGAATRPRLTGAVVGVASAGIGAAFYAANCTDDSPLFVATWYTIATAITAAIGAAIGGRVLRW